MGQHDFTPVGAPQRNWFARHKAPTIVLGVLALLVLLLVIPFGSDSGQGTDAAPGTQPSVFTQQNAPQPQASTAPSKTKASITEEIQQDAVGMVAADSSVVTAAKCRPARRNPGSTWTAHCTVTYTDGSKVPGNITLIPATNRLAFQPDGT